MVPPNIYSPGLGIAAKSAHFNKPAPSGLPSYDTSFFLRCQRISTLFPAIFWIFYTPLSAQ